MSPSRRFVLDKANIGACIIVLLLATGIASAGGILTQWLVQSFWFGFITVIIMIVAGAVMLYRSRHPAQIVSAASPSDGAVVSPSTPPIPEQHQEQQALLDDTAEFPPLIMETEATAQRVPPRKNTSSYTVTSGENGDQYLLVEHWRKSGRRKNMSWTNSTTKLRLNDMSLIDTRILMRGVFEPNSDEKVIEVAKRRHWWSHTPQQVGVFLAWLAGIIAIGFGIDKSSSGATWLWLLGLIWTIAWAITGFLVWMKWAYTYFIVTDRRILLIYRPPAPFPADSNQSPMSKLQGLRSSESAIGRLLKFGTIYSETAASETDEWIKAGVDYLKDTLRIEARISGYTK